MSESPTDEMPNGLISANSIKPSEILQASSPKMFPLPYKRRKLMEYVNSQTLSGSTPAVSQPPNNATEVTVLAVISSLVSPTTLVTPNMSNSVTSVTTSDVRDSLLLSSSSQNCSPVPRNSAECEEASSGRSSLSSISSTEDIKTESNFSEAKRGGQSNGTVDSSTGCASKPLSSNRLSSSSQDGAPEESTNCLTQSPEVTTAKDSGSHVGSSVEAIGHSTAMTSGGKKKVRILILNEWNTEWR